MMLAAIGDYFQPWQVPIFLGMAAAWAAGGPFLTRWALRGASDSPEPKLLLGRCALINLLANGAGMAAMCVVILLFAALGARVGPRALALGGLVLGPAAMLGMSWAVHSVMLGQAGRQPLRGSARSAGPLAALALAALIGVFAPAYFARQEQAKVGRCGSNLDKIATALDRHAAVHAGGRAASLQELVDEGFLEAQCLRCPARPQQPSGYLYQPSKLVPRRESTSRIHVCDRHGNHAGQRLVLLANGSLASMSERKFQEALELPENAELARLAAADK